MTAIKAGERPVLHEKPLAFIITRAASAKEDSQAEDRQCGSQSMHLDIDLGIFSSHGFNQLENHSVTALRRLGQVAIAALYRRLPVLIPGAGHAAPPVLFDDGALYQPVAIHLALSDD